MGISKQVSAGDVPRTQVLSVPYMLWLATVMTTTLAGAGASLALVAQALETMSAVGAWDSPLSWFDAEVTWKSVATMVGIAVLTHGLRVHHSISLAAAVHIPFPGKLVAGANSGDPIIDKYDYHCRGTINVSDGGAKGVVRSRSAEMQRALESGLALAVSDPEARYAKQKMERIMRLPLGEVVDLDRITGIEIQHNRAVRRPV